MSTGRLLSSRAEWAVVLDPGKRGHACECYGVVRRNFEQLFALPLDEPPPG